MQVEFPLRVGVAVLAVAAIVVTGGSMVFATDGGDRSYNSMDEAIVTLEDGSELWPYTSRSPSADDRTLALNLIIYGDADMTRHILQERQFRDWQEVNESREDLAPAEEFDVGLNQTTLGWGHAHGANRWIWVNSSQGEHVWLGEAYQLERGDYLGHRHHIRVYEDPEHGQWSALQAHAEHWDWFHLRHTVHSIEESQLAVDEELYDRWYVDELYRERFGNDASSDSDGWVTIVHLDDEWLPELVGMLVIGLGAMASVGARERIREMLATPVVGTGVRALSLIAGIVLAYHLVRFGAVGLERSLIALNPKLIVAIFYPLLVVGLPVLTYLLARKIDATTAFWAATIGFVVATFVDYTYLGVMRIPLETFVHRAALAIAIGLIAAGASMTAREPEVVTGYVRTGVILWFVAVCLPLLQFL